MRNGDHAQPRAQPCPLCYSKDTRKVKSLSVEPLVEEWSRRFFIDVRAEFKNLSRFEMRACRNCALQYFAPDSLAGSRELYAQLKKFDWYYMPRKWEYEVALRDLCGCKKALEVGCGSGDFMIMTRQKLGIEIEGLEQNPEALREAERRGLSICMSTVEKAAEQQAATYDAVCSFQVLEHVSRPGDFLTSCCALLRPGGKLLLGLPNANSFLRYQYNLLDLPPHHMTRWTAGVLSHLSHTFPLKLQRIAYESLADYHVEGYVEAYASLLRRMVPGSLLGQRVRSLAAGLIRKARLGRFLRGQTMYACYTRGETP
jgi:2-polyprenyl-3-methyl-5-hydroxy-6-metoxy-1,4-benzoquinol methylase